MKRFLLPLSSVVLVTYGAAASAQSRDAARDAARAACASDHHKYCADAGRGHGLECLSTHRSQLGADCAAAVKSAMERRQSSGQ